MSEFEGVKKFLDLCRTNIEEFEEEMRTASQLKLFNNTSDISLLYTNIRLFSGAAEMSFFGSKVSFCLKAARKGKDDIDKEEGDESKRLDIIDGRFKFLSSSMCVCDSMIDELSACNANGCHDYEIIILESEKKRLRSEILSCCEEKGVFIIEYVKRRADSFCLERKIYFYESVGNHLEECSELEECFSKFIFDTVTETSRIKDDVSSKFDSFIRENETLIEETKSLLSRYSDRSETEPFLDSILPNLQEWLKSVYNFYYNTIEINVLNFMIAYHIEYINALTEERQRLLDCKVKIHAQISKLSVFLNECKVEEKRSIKKYKECARDFLLLIDRFFVIKFTIEKLGIFYPDSIFDSLSSPLKLNEREIHKKIYFWPCICDIDYVIAETQKILENEKKLADEFFSSLEVNIEALKSSLILMEDKKANGIEATDEIFFNESMVEFFLSKAECDLSFDKVKNIFYSIVYFEKVLIKLAVTARDELVALDLLTNKINEEISSCSIKKETIENEVGTRESDIYVFEQIEQAYREALFDAFEEIDGRLSTLK